MSHHHKEPKLASRIAETSAKHSLFEEEIRKLPVPVCSVFLDKTGNIRPTGFMETDTVLQSKDHERTAEVFPLTVGKNRNVVLEATRPQTPEKVDCTNE